MAVPVPGNRLLTGFLVATTLALATVGAAYARDDARSVMRVQPRWRVQLVLSAAQWPDCIGFPN
jgi:hypothetical protein